MHSVLSRAASFFRRLPDTTRTILVTVILSLAAAISAVAFLFLTNTLFNATFGWFSRQNPVVFLVASFAMIMSTSLAVGVLLTRLSPEAAGSGIPQLKAAYWKDLGYVPIRPVIIKFVAGVLSIGGGTSLGREGPTVFMSGGLASWLSGFTGSAKQERRNPALVGASAGLAAAFNTPLAAITFVLEEIVGDISSRSIGRVLLSAVIGAFTVYALIGRQPAFQVPGVDEVTWIHYAITPVVAMAASLLGVFFHHQVLALRKKVKRQRRLPAWLLPVMGGLITWAIGASIFLATGKLGVFGLGYLDLSSVLRNDFVWWVAGILVVGKLLATIASYGFGGCGGIFSPLLFIGGLSGYFIGGLVSQWLPLSPSDLIVLSAVGMSACLGTVVKAPLSALLIVFEMTHQFAMVPALLIGMFISMAVSRLTGSENFYDAILLQDGHELHRIRPPLDISGWQKQPVSAIMNRKPVCLASFAKPAMAALVEGFPYACFPVMGADMKPRGIATRKAILEAIQSKASPAMLPLVACGPSEPIHAAAERLMDSASNFIVVLDDSTGRMLGILTLHDLLRAQAAVME
jgi:CIC family chloride channel protein